MSKVLYKGIIITGNSCAGKSSIAEALCAGESASFKIVPAVTTRAYRDNDSNYKYIDDKKFDDLDKEKKLLTNTSYREKKYGIEYSEFEAVLDSGAVPILILTPDSAIKLLEEFNQTFMCFFIEATNEELISRWEKREKRKIADTEKKGFIKRSDSEREYAYRCNYVLQNNKLDASISLVKKLWEYRNTGGGLSHDLLELMISCGMLLERANLKCLNGASYDLLLGDEFYYGGKIKKLSDSDPFLSIEPYDYAIVSCKETAYMPRDVIAKFGLTVGLFCQGIILSNGPQIDPGFRGTLFCLLFNTSNRTVYLKRGKHYATIEFNKLIEPAKPYEGKYQGTQQIIEYIPSNALQGAINELKKEIEALKNESKFMQNIYLGVAALMFAIISILLVLR